MVKSYTTEAIILNRFNYSEADKILTLFTKNHGKLTAIAKGLRKPQSKRKGHLELFNHIRCQLITGHTWDILTEVETLHHFAQLTTDNRQLRNSETAKLETISSAYHYAELIDRFLPEREPHPDIFDLLANTLQALTNNQKLETKNQKLKTNIDHYFKHRLIRSLGFWPSDRTVPDDLDAFIDSLLNSPLKTSNFALYNSPT